ncbi:hypothetical protein E0L93_08750 [Rubrobacter taiwanensis]|jgi:hypothetical protein|uniref:Uncharacterized protein n=1 Tax=Rubrobacter taiwanensis TaxID=185139 RepID=A0A4R1BHS6_9ACTN|nr:hypothetical protein [Rubrobacter taiwanensis]TCJ16800.1 hypothetical protein E0L93_08750 [Rubrobacter taiwanensis]
MRERIAYVILVGVMFLLFALTFAILGRGEYEPPGGEHGAVVSYEVAVSGAAGHPPSLPAHA